MTNADWLVQMCKDEPISTGFRAVEIDLGSSLPIGFGTFTHP